MNTQINGNQIKDGSITSVGTIIEGTWEADIINQAYLGTGGGGSTKFLREDNTWQTISSGGITSLNTLTTATQTFATGTSGTDFNISSLTSTHTFNIPTASASNRGLLSSANWSTFNNKANSGINADITALTALTSGTVMTLSTDSTGFQLKTGGNLSSNYGFQLWDNTSNGNNKVLVAGNGTSFTENVALYANGYLDITRQAGTSGTAYDAHILATNTNGFAATRGTTTADSATIVGGFASGQLVDDGRYYAFWANLNATTGGGLLVQGTGGNRSDELGKHVTLWGKTNGNTNKMISIGSGSSSFTENAYVLASGVALFPSIELGATDTTLTRSSAGNVAIEGNVIYRAGGTDVTLADGGTGSSLADPGANRLWGWDDTDNTIGFWTIGSGLSYDHSTHTLSASGAVGGSDTQVQFNDGGSFGGDADFTWNKTTNTLTFSNSSTISAGLGLFLQATGDGFGFDFETSSGTSSGSTGGNISFSQGSGTAGNAKGGSVDWTTGNGFGSQTGGYFFLTAGDGGATGAGGPISLTAGNGGATSGNGASISLFAGNATAGVSSGGDFSVGLGAATGGGTAGRFRIFPAGGVLEARLDFNSIASSTKTFTFPNATGQVTLDGNATTLSNKTLTAPKFANAGFIADASGNELIIFTTTASAVNEITLANAATGNNPKFTASGGDSNVGFDFQAKGTGTYRLLGTSNQAAELRLYEDTDDGTNYTAFKIGTQSADITYTLPTAVGAPNSFLKDVAGNGVLSWATVSGSTPYYTWNEVTGTSQSAAVNNAYIANNAGLVTVTIPTTAAVGDRVLVTGKGAGGWAIAQNASEIIHFGNLDTTTGTGGSLASTNRRDTVELVCVVADTEWNVISSIGNITVV